MLSKRSYQELHTVKKKSQVVTHRQKDFKVVTHHQKDATSSYTPSKTRYKYLHTVKKTLQVVTRRQKHVTSSCTPSKRRYNRAQNNGPSTNNVRPDWGFDRSNLRLAGHVDRTRWLVTDRRYIYRPFKQP